MKYGKSILVSMAISSLLMGSVSSSASASSKQDAFSEKALLKVFKQLDLQPFTLKSYSSKYEAFLEGDEPQEKRKNQKVSKITMKGESIEARYETPQRRGSVVKLKVEEVQDNRKRVEKPDIYPNSTNVFMEMFFGKGREELVFNGSGVMVGPQHVLTAAHNVYDNKISEWAEYVKVSPGANSGSAHFGTSIVVGAFVPKEYVDGNHKHDLAFLVLSEDLGKQTGWATITALNDDEFEDTAFKVTGYPGDKEAGQLWEMEGRIADTEDEVLKHKIATVQGQSGSPLWQTPKRKPPRVVGVHVRGEDTWNEATRITRNHLDWIIQCFKESESRLRSQSHSSSSSAASSSQQQSVSSQGSSPARSLTERKEESKTSGQNGGLVIPEIARGYEDIYKRFLKGALVYRPTPGSDAGKIELPIGALANPLEGMFDLSWCGDTGKYLSIATGYRKGKNPQNKDKVEIWIAPRFMIEKELATTAGHFKEIMGKWNKDRAPVGLFWTYGVWAADDHDMDYLTDNSFDQVGDSDFWEKYKKSTHERWSWDTIDLAPGRHFMFRF